MWKNLRSQFKALYEGYVEEFRYVLHDGGIVLFFCFLPLAYPIIYSLIYNPEVVRDVRMVVVDHDRTPKSRELVRNLDACQEVWITGYAADLGEARRAMDSHDCYGILEIPEGFQRKIGRCEQSPAVMYCDMSLLLRYRGFLVAATNVAQEMGSEILASKIDETLPIAATISTGDPLPIDNISLGNIENGFDSFIMPGVIVLILHQCIILASGMAGGGRREHPLRMGVDPRKPECHLGARMIAEMLCYITILIPPTLFLLHYVPLMFAFPMAGNILEIFTFIMPMMLACLGLGFCFQGIVWERESVFLLWVVTSVAFLFLSGLTWPRYAMSPFWHFVSGLVPATWGVEGFIKMNTNGSTLSQVSPEYIRLWILAAVYLAAGYCVRRWWVMPAVRQRASAILRQQSQSEG